MRLYKVFILISTFLLSLKVELISQPLEFEDPFDGNENGWTVFDNPRGQVKIESGELTLKNSSKKSLLSLIDHFIDPNVDFTISASIKILSPKGKIGVVWGAMGNVSFHGLNVFADSTFNVVNNKNGNFFQVIQKQKLPLGGFEAGTPSILKIIKRGIEVSFEINGRLLETTMFSNFYGSEIGFSIDPGTTAAVDYIRVNQPPVTINLATDYSGFIKENIGHQVNSLFAENGVMLSPDGSTMYVVRNGHPGNMGQMKKDDIWVSFLDPEGNWSRLNRLDAPLNNRGSNFVISVAPDGNTLLVANTYKEDGAVGGPGLSITRKSNTGWEVPKKIEINNFRNDSRFVDFCLTPDGQVLVMSIDNGNTNGGMDLFASFKEREQWSEPVNLGNDINTFANDFTPFVAADNSTLYFASFGHAGYGSADLFVARRLDSSWQLWSDPQNLGPDINTKSWDANLSIPAKGDYAYLTSNQNSIGDIDIFRIKLHESLRPKPVVLVRGKVINSMTQKGEGALITYYDLFDGRFLGEAHSDPSSGSYRIVLPAGESYSFLAEKAGFYPIGENIDALQISEYTEIERNLHLGPIVKGSTIRLNNIFFETGKYNLRSESYHELNRLIQLMNDHQEMVIEIAGHTDSDGSDTFNQQLSESRAKEVYNYLLPYFPTERISFKGYGEAKPLVTNETDAGRRQNRRVEFTILSME
ncbi:MAG: OmpA family protein [Cyclobacteriaceae bacterium]